MQRVLWASMIGIVPIVSALAPSAVRAQDIAPNPQVEIVYAPPSVAFSRNFAIRNRLTDQHVLEQLQKFLAPLKLPRKLTIQTDECGQETRPYKSGQPATICYEMVDKIEQLAAKNSPDDTSTQAMVTIGGFVQVALHEVSHAVFDILQIPIWGREDDAADRLTAFLMLQFGPSVATVSVIGATLLFKWASDSATWTGSKFAAVNSPEAQRFYNYMCIAFGGAVSNDDDDLQKFTAGFLTAIRGGEQCLREYQQVRKSFYEVIMPNVDQDLLIKAQAAQWVFTSDGK